MGNLASRFWNDEYGAVMSAELVVILTLLIIGMVVGLTCLQGAVVEELMDTGCAIGSLDQSFHYAGFRNVGVWGGCTKSWKAGSSYFDPEGCGCRHATAADVGERETADFGARPCLPEVTSPPVITESPCEIASPAIGGCPVDTWVEPCPPCLTNPVQPAPLLAPPLEQLTPMPPVPTVPEPEPYEPIQRKKDSAA
jgi:Flp pilus assembly pilin Flp